jgi:SAM-dependent methyltransferase
MLKNAPAAKPASVGRRCLSESRYPRLDPADPNFWEVRYRDNFAPWDAGKVPKMLVEYVAHSTPPRKILVPGCGSAHETRFLIEAGWPALAIDFSAAAVAKAINVLGPFANHVRKLDFFSPELGPGSFDFIYERAFLCALPRRMWNAWAKRNTELLAPGGRLAGFFYFGEGERGPPFGLKAGELEALLQNDFQRVELSLPDDSITVFQGKEQWQVWQKL